jgi:serine/threonine protein kinase/cytochrome c-type biogenesis protein CcmH/NrfG
MDQRNHCRGCGTERPSDAPSGLCPACLLKAGMLGDGSKIPDLTITFGPASSSVLARFGEAFGKIPPILLRDTDSINDPSPVIRPSSPEIPDPAERSARLQLFGEIARGGMGAVLKGRDSDLGRDLAVKVLLESHREKPEMVRRFIEEAQIAGQLQHPGIVPIYELGAFGDHRPYFAMKLVKGHTLAEILANRKAPTDGLPRFLSIFESICQTMAYAHARGVIHRDLKPSNVMVGSFGEVQVMDWGLAKVLPRGGAIDDASAGQSKDQGTIIATARTGSDNDLSQAGSVMGTPSYMAPEQARGEIDEIDERADVFALGSIFAEILTGEPAFTGRNSGEIQRKAARGDLSAVLARLDDKIHGHDPELIALTRACLALEPEDRPRNAGEVADRMSEYHSRVQDRLRQSEIARAEDKARAEEATKRASVERDRRRLTVALAAAILVMSMLVGGGSFWLYRQRQARLSGIEGVIVRVQTLREQARNLGADPLPWRETLAAADQALTSIGDLATTEPGRRLSSLRDTVVEEEKQAAREKTLLADLKVIRSNRGRDDTDPNRDYPEAFRRYGLNLVSTSQEQSVARLKDLPEVIRREIVTFLDDWAASYKTVEGAKSVSPLALAKGLDPNEDRNRLRTLLEKEDLEGDAETLRALAKQSKLIESGPTTLLLLASALRKAGDNSTAEAMLREALLQYPGDVWLNYELADLCRDRTDKIHYASIARALGAPVGEFADSFERLGKSEEAKAIYRDETKMKPSYTHYWYVYIDLLKRKGTAEEVREVRDRWVSYVNDQIRLSPNDAIRHYHAAEAYFELDDIPNLIASLQESARLTKQGRSAVYWCLGHALFVKGELKPAENAYREAIRLDPEDISCRYELASTLCHSGDHKGEAEVLQEALKLRKESSSLRKTERMAVSESGSWVPVIDIQDFVGRWDVGYHALASALAESGDMAGAKAAFREAIRRKEYSSQNLSPYRTSLVAVLYNDDPAEIVPELREAIRLDPGLASSAVGFYLAMALVRIGDFPGAINLIKNQKEPKFIDYTDLLVPVILTDDKKDSIATLRQLRNAAKEETSVVQWIDRVILMVQRLAEMGPRLPKLYHGYDGVFSYLQSLQGNFSLPGQFPNRRLYAVAGDLWQLAFELDPNVYLQTPFIPTLMPGVRAAICAAKTGCGEAKDQPPIDEAAKAELRAKSLKLLKDLIASYEVEREEKKPDDEPKRDDVIIVKSHVIRDISLTVLYGPEEFGCVRYSAALAKLPEAERKAWEAFWTEFEELWSEW